MRVLLRIDAEWLGRPARVALVLGCLAGPLMSAPLQSIDDTSAPPLAAATSFTSADTGTEAEQPTAPPLLEAVPEQVPAAAQPAQTPAPTTPTPGPGAGPFAAARPPAPPASGAQRFSFAPGAAGTARGRSRSSDFVMLGDRGPLATRRVIALQTPGLPNPFPPPGPPNVPGARFATLLVPTMRGIKISENQSPRPQDRIYYSFNYFDGVNDSINTRLNSPVNNMRVMRNIWGFEKTFNDGQGSFGLRLPMNTIWADQTVARSFGNFGGTSTSLGNLNLIGKYILLEDEESGSLLSGGLVISPPTGNNQFAGANYFNAFNYTTFQPFAGYIWNSGDFFLHGFSGLDIPTSDADVTLMYNDIGVGYFLRNDGPDDPERFLTMIAPTFEVHINTPLNHRDPFNPFDPAATPDIVNLTYGLNLGFRPNVLFSTGFVTPVTGPQPFDFEFMALLNVYFGGPRRNITPPVLGGF